MSKTFEKSKAWLGVDLDCTLAHYTDWSTNGGAIGNPVPAMVERVKRWLAQGVDVRIFTARVHPSNPRHEEDAMNIRAWTEEHIGVGLPVTCSKDFNMVALWDDLAVSVEPNTGWRMTASMDDKDPLSHKEEMVLCGYEKDPAVLLRDIDTKEMMVSLAQKRGLISQYDPAFVNPPKLVTNAMMAEAKAANKKEE